MKRLLGLALAATLLAACGGGGGDGPTAPGGMTIDLVESESFSLMNQARQQENVKPDLGFDATLAQIARRHSEAMRDQGFFDHTGPGSPGLRQRLSAAGIQYRGAAENLAQVRNGADPAGAAHNNLMGSPGHRKNILDPSFRRAAVGVARSGDTYWITQIFIQP